MGLLDTVSVARKGIGAASAGIDVTSQNVSNAGTVGYSRRKLTQTTADPIQRRGLWIGTGPRLTGISRATDRLLGARLVATTGAASRSTAMHGALSAAEVYLSGDGGVAPSENPPTPGDPEGPSEAPLVLPVQEAPADDASAPAGDA